jgi:hypothetical protein
VKGKLLLDSREGIRKGGELGPAVVPFKTGQSLLLQAVRHARPGLKMPPNGKLPDAVIADLERWIAMGAPDPRETSATPAPKKDRMEEGRKFWAFQPPKAAALPRVANAAWPKNPIDSFTLAKMEAKGVQPVADAEKAALLRRLYFDLIGLPPSPAEIDQYLQEASAKPQAALEHVVDRLLASPHFGERWGRHWLDVARFAESSGGGRSLLFPDAWRYRDYVIAAFNDDKPYDRFITEQIAGDLLPYNNPKQREQQLVATSFLVLGATNYEEQDKDNLETDVIDEQLDTMGRAFLGMTIGCARCHDHKFDPIPARDYYALAGIFRNTQTLIHDNVSHWVDVPLPMTAEQDAAWKKHELAVNSLKEKIRLAKEEEKKLGIVDAGSRPKIIAVKDLPGIVLDDSQAKKVGEWTHSKYSGSYIGDGYLHDGDKDKGQKTLTFVPDFPHSGRYEVRLAYTPGTNRATNVPVHVLHADGEQKFHVDETKPPPIDEHFVSIGTFRFEKGSQWYVIISNEGTNGHVIVDAVQFLPEDEKPHPTVTNNPSTQPKERRVSSKDLEAELKRLTDKAPPRPMAMSVKEAAKIGDFFVCIRGNVHNRGADVPRGFLQVATTGPMPQLPAKESGRRELAAWLSSSDNPLTARVIVNRIWHHLFGSGIVRTVDVFGTTGELPSHPELLDFLALRFVQDGWSIKKMIRMIVLSHSYQLACANPDARDPENRSFSRMHHRRLEAEAIRDSILFVSGQLDCSLGGPNVKPGTATEVGYTFDDRRRSVYTPIFRNRLLELFEVFDFADPNLVLGRRNVSTVLTQALFLLNNHFVQQQAQLAARRLLAETGRDDSARLEQLFRTALGRLPTTKEREMVLRFLAENSGKDQTKAWEQIVQTVFACMDFRYVN